MYTVAAGDVEIDKGLCPCEWGLYVYEEPGRFQLIV